MLEAQCAILLLLVAVGPPSVVRGVSLLLLLVLAELLLLILSLGWGITSKRCLLGCRGTRVLGIIVRGTNRIKNSRPSLLAKAANPFLSLAPLLCELGHVGNGLFSVASPGVG